MAAFLLPAQAGAHVVAVLPFRNLSEKNRAIGEAIRETVTTDLKEVGGMKLVERAQINKILAEQNLQSKQDDLDPLSSVKLGKLCGASLLVTGAYQKVASNVRLTARFISVETGEIVGTAKVDGAQVDFLTLQDRITAQLLRSAGMESKHVEAFAARKRPKVRSIRTIELYGDAVVEPNDQKRKELLVETVKLDPGFVYASRDLDALEKRMQAYAQKASDAQDQATRSELGKLDAQLASEKDPVRLYTFLCSLMGRLSIEKRLRTLIAVSHKMLATSFAALPPSYASLPSLHEYAQKYLFEAHVSLKDVDGALREGERYLQKYPTGQSFAYIQSMMNTLVDRKRDLAQGQAKAEQEMANWEPPRRGNPCETGPIYHAKRAYQKARADMEACSKRPDPAQVWFPAYMLVLINEELGDFKEARRWLEVLRTQNDEKYRGVRDLDRSMPHEQ